MINVGIVGGTGYTGIELLRVLGLHDHVELRAITSRKEAGMPVADMFPSLRGHVALTFSDPDKADLGSCDVVFFATPAAVLRVAVFFTRPRALLRPAFFRVRRIMTRALSSRSPSTARATPSP